MPAITFSRYGFLTVLKAMLPVQNIGAEIGVLNGDFSAELIDRIDPSRLFLVDPFEENKKEYTGALTGQTTAYSTETNLQYVSHRFNREIRFGKVYVIRKYSFDAVKQFPDETLDFVYHDASHRYEDIKRDLNEWLPKLKKDGLVCGHDYTNLEGFGVVKAVDEFMKQHNFKMMILNENGGDYLLKRRV